MMPMVYQSRAQTYFYQKVNIELPWMISWLLLSLIYELDHNYGDIMSILIIIMIIKTGPSIQPITMAGSGPRSALCQPGALRHVERHLRPAGARDTGAATTGEASQKNDGQIKESHETICSL